MREPSFTPGPWRVNTEAGNRLVVATTPTLDEITAAGFGDAGSVKESHANACLIAAAPDMAVAIREAVEHCETCREYTDHIFSPARCARCQTFVKLLEQARWFGGLVR